MGGRGSGGGRSSGGGSASKIQDEVTKNLMNRLENNLENINKKLQENPSYEKTQRLKEDAAAIKDQMEYYKKTEKKPRQTKAKMSVDSTVSDLKYNLRRNVQTDGYISNSDFRVEDYGDTINVSIRYLGKWKNPSHARYEEDYDWQELNKSSGKQIDKVVKKLAKQSGRKITWGTSEKNWIDFDIEKKKGD